MNLLKIFALTKYIKMPTMRKQRKKEGFMQKLIKSDTNVSMMNFFLLATLAVGVLLLFIPAIGIIVDIIYNHTITVNMSDISSYIIAVAGIFAAGGLSSAWTEFAYSKYDIKPITEEDMARAEEAIEAIEEAGNDEELMNENNNN